MKLKFVVPSGHVVTLGTFLPVRKEDLKRYIRNHQLSWVIA